MFSCMCYASFCGSFHPGDARMKKSLVLWESSYDSTLGNQSAKVTRHRAIPLGSRAAFQSQDSSFLHHFAVKCSSTHACQALESPTITVRLCKRHTILLSTGNKKRTIMDLQNLISLNRLFLTASAAAWQHKRSASLTFTDVLGLHGVGRKSFSKIQKEWRKVTVALHILQAKRGKR